MKIKLSKLEWKKFIKPNIILSTGEIMEDMYDYEKIRKILKPPCLIKLKNNELLSVGDMNTLFGACDCCSLIGLEDILEYYNLEIEE